MATAKALDFTNVSDGGGGRFNRKHQPTADYEGKIVKVEDAPSKKDGVFQWLFTIQVGPGTYPYYCKHDPELLWKIRNLWEAAGITVPKKKLKVDPSKVVGRTIGVTLEDDDYNDKLRSQIASVFPASELEGGGSDEEEEEEDDEEEEAPPPPKKTKKKAKPAPVEEEEEEEDELEELEIEDI